MDLSMARSEEVTEVGYIQHPYPAVYWAQVGLGLVVLAEVAALAWWAVRDLRKAMREAEKTESTTARSAGPSRRQK